MDTNELVARFIRNARWEDLPLAVQRKAKLCFLDALCSALSGKLARVAHVAADFAVARAPRR